MNPTISTWPVESSCTMAGARPSILSKSICICPHKLLLQHAVKQKARRFFEPAGLLIFISALYLASTGLRRHVRRVMVVMMMAMCEGNHEPLC
jgi:hypothetical protein